MDNTATDQARLDAMKVEALKLAVEASRGESPAATRARAEVFLDFLLGGKPRRPVLNAAPDGQDWSGYRPLICTKSDDPDSGLVRVEVELPWLQNAIISTEICGEWIQGPHPKGLGDDFTIAFSNGHAVYRVAGVSERVRNNFYCDLIKSPETENGA